MAAATPGPTASLAGHCLHQLFEAAAEARPESLAVVADDVALTYGELEGQANRLASHLRARGVGREVVVGLCVARSLDLVVATLAVLKAGGAVLPLDPSYPPGRLAANLADAKAALVLTHSQVAGRLPQGPPTLCLDTEWATAAAAPAAAASTVAGPDTLAYVIYTSGSTGEPKGVALPHRGLVNEVVAVADMLGLGPSDRVVQFCSISFDVSVEELFATFSAGATLVLRPENVPVLGREWLDWLERQRVTVLDLPTAYWHEWVRDLSAAGAEVPRGIRAVVVGGERAVGRAYRAWLEVGGRRVRWLNAYGPAEASVMATVWEPPLGTELPEGADPPIGRPLPGTTALVLDDAGAPAPVGVPGELHLGGVGLARGYLGRADLTAQRFVPDPTVPGSGARLYRTGDLVRRLPGGDLEFVGRLDDQVKVRGFRIECGEVEAALLAHPAVDEAVVVAREDEPGNRRLVAYVVVSSGAGPAASDTGELRRFLTERLPPYMVPTAFVGLGSLPLTATGKVDRRALPAPAPSRPEAGRLPPRTDTEKALAAIWSRVLGVEEVGVEEDFFDLGGQSLLATQVIAEVREVFGADVPLRGIFEAPTVAALAARVEGGGARWDLPPLVARERVLGRPLSLSLAQEQMWGLERTADPPGLYNVTALHRFEGPADADLLRRALASLVERHETLRTGFGTDDGGPSQWVATAAAVDLAVSDLSRLPPDVREGELRRGVAEEDARPFDLASPPLLRCHLFLLPTEAVLSATFDHLVCDGPSAYLFLGELGEAYGAMASGGLADLPPLELQYADFAVWQRSWATAERLEAQLEYWTRVLRDMPLGPAVPFDHLPSAPARQVEKTVVGIGPRTYRALDRLGRTAKATVFVVCVAAVESLLSRAGGTTDIVMSTTLSGRQRAELEGMVGMFAGIARIRTDLGGDPTFQTVLERARDTVWGMFENQDIPFMRVRQALFPDFPTSGVEVAAAVPVHLDYFPLSRAQAVRGAALTDRPVDELFFRGQLHPLTITFLDDGTQLRCELSFKTAFYDRATIEGLASGLERLLEAVTRDPSLRLSELPPRAEAPTAGSLPETREARVVERHALSAAPVGADEVIRTEGLTKVYPPSRDRGGGVTAVDHLDLSVFEGEIFGLLGPNGAGKTTTVGMLTTRVLPTEGRATVNGIDIVAEPALAKRFIGVVPQFNTLDRSLNVWENLYFHGRYFGMSARAARAATDELLERLRLATRAGSDVRSLSGGMAKRLMVARALLHAPSVLFLDEPTAALDPQSRLVLWDIVGQLHAEGQTILLTTHYIEEADRFCDRVAIMDHGRILALDTPTGLKQAVASERGTLKATLDRHLADLANQGEGETVDGGRRADTERALVRVLATARQLGIDLDQLPADDVTLETVFIELTGRELRE